MPGPLKRHDLLMIALSIGIWVAAVVHVMASGERAHFSIALSSATSATSHPTVIRAPDSSPGTDALQSGDILLELNDCSLSGWSAISTLDAAWLALESKEDVAFRIERNAELLTARARPKPAPTWWVAIPLSGGLLVTSLLILIRAPGWHLSRRYFAACWCFAFGFTLPFFGEPERELYGALSLVLFSSAYGLTMWNAQDWTKSGMPVPRWHRALLPCGVLAYVAFAINDMWLSTSLTRHDALDLLQVGVAAAVTLLALTRSYLLADAAERRQLRWIMVGFYIAFAGGLVTNLPGVASMNVGRVIISTTVLAIPLGIMISITGYRYLDVDRVISLTASYSVVGATALIAALFAIPLLVSRVSGTFALSPGTAQSAMTLALVGIAIPVHRYLRPRLDRRMFADRHERQLGFEQLIRDLGDCTNLEELTQLSGERIDILLEPESIAIYARQGTAFGPVFARGSETFPSFRVDSPLVHLLEQRARPLAADATELDPFDRAALETLDASVVFPTRRAEVVVAFTCIGRKRSTDIYTPEDLAHMSAVASRCSEILSKLNSADLIREARELQQSMRRYVPGAVAEELAKGRDLESSEREICVLFVDIRGYSGFAEKRSARETFSTINKYTREVSRFVDLHGGVVVEFNGDGMMVVFGALRDLAHKERAAVECAREIVTGLSREISVGIGIATGVAFVGNIQSVDRLIWSAIGNTTNLAARLQSLTRDLEAKIAIDRLTRERAGSVSADFKLHAAVAIRGRSDRRDVWTLPLAAGAADHHPADRSD